MKYPGPVDYAATVILSAWEKGVGQADAVAEISAMVEIMEADLEVIKVIASISHDQELPVADMVRKVREIHLRGEPSN